MNIFTKFDEIIDQFDKDTEDFKDKLKKKEENEMGKFYKKIWIDKAKKDLLNK